jgi:hypothetical protein
VAFTLHQLEFLPIAIERSDPKSDAWLDFVVDCGERLSVSRHGGLRAVVVPDDIWECWLSVSRGTNDDYDELGNRTVTWAA